MQSRRASPAVDSTAPVRGQQPGVLKAHTQPFDAFVVLQGQPFVAGATGRGSMRY